MLKAHKKLIYQWTCGLQAGIFRQPDSLVFVNKEISKAPGSQSVSVKPAWALPVFGSH